MSLRKRRALLYFVKFPEPGKVKTRLAQTVGNEQAAASYRRLAETNLFALKPLAREGISIAVTFDPPDREVEMKRWLSGPFEYLPQDGEGLTERLQNAFAHTFRAGSERVIALGSDTIGLNANHIREAFQALEGSDVVVGPAKDGGYYLIGLKKFIPQLFKEIPWSTSSVLKFTLLAIKSEKLSFHLMEELEDLDEMNHLNRKEVLR